jgi:hypothetical protein
MADPPIRTFYRIVQHDPSTENDFLPYAARGGPVPADPELRRMWHGISVYDTLDRAVSRARKQPTLGGYIAELQIPWGGSIRAESELAIDAAITRSGESPGRSLHA